MKISVLTLGCKVNKYESESMMLALKEQGHVKDLYCVHCHDVTKCLEIRNRDYLPDVMDQARDLAEEYYGKVNKDVLLNDGVLASSFF